MLELPLLDEAHLGAVEDGNEDIDYSSRKPAVPCSLLRTCVRNSMWTSGEPREHAGRTLYLLQRRRDICAGQTKACLRKQEVSAAVRVERWSQQPRSSEDNTLDPRSERPNGRSTSRPKDDTEAEVVVLEAMVTLQESVSILGHE